MKQVVVSVLLALAAWAQLSSGNVSAMAIYAAGTNTSDTLNDTSVNYNVTTPNLIDSILSGIEFGVQRDCSGIESKNSAYVYVKFKDGNRKVYDLFLENSHIAIRERRDLCFFVNSTSQSLIAANAQH